MANKTTISKNWPKYVLQWGVLAALVFFFSGLYKLIFPEAATPDPEKYCPFGGLQALATYIQRGSLPCSMTSLQIVMGIGLAAAVVLFSKLFCAFICPIGTIEDLLFKLRKKIGLNGVQIRNGSIADKLLRVLKYALLFWIVYMTVTASELFCKNLDPYYAVATGFKGEITLWMSLTSISLVILLGVVIDRFWCKYICPLGAISNTLKFWAWILLLVAIWWGLSLLGLNISWWWFLAAFCLAGYLLEILSGKPKMQIIGVAIDQDKCGRKCYSCRKNCPYGIDVPSFGKRVDSVDCMLCGECMAACPTQALSIGVKPNKCGISKYIPAILAVVIALAAFFAGKSFELPTISETWGLEDGMKTETVVVDGLRSVKCFSSSKAFKAKLERIAGVHGVKTYVGSHRAAISFDPKVTSAEKIQEQIFVPTVFRVNSPSPTQYSRLKVATIRTEHMSDKMDLNYLGLQMRQTDKKIFGLDSQYDCPLIVHVYIDPEEEIDAAWYKQIVEMKSLDMPVHGGGIKKTPVDFEFVRLEPEISYIGIEEYLEKMFDRFTAEFNGRYPSADTTIVRKRTEVYADKPQYIYEIADQNFEKPIIRRGLPYLSNHLSKEEGVIGVYLKLNKSLFPSLQIRFAAPMTEDKLWELLNAEKWTITYSAEDVRQENPRIKFHIPGTCYKYEE